MEKPFCSQGKRLAMPSRIFSSSSTIISVYMLRPHFQNRRTVCRQFYYNKLPVSLQIKYGQAEKEDKKRRKFVSFESFWKKRIKKEEKSFLKGLEKRRSFFKISTSLNEYGRPGRPIRNFRSIAGKRLLWPRYRGRQAAQAWQAKDIRKRRKTE